MYHIISFDIGIKNLAVCKMEENMTITLWELIKTDGSIKNIIHKLKSIDFFVNDNHEDIYDILIEKQPRYNPKMRIVSSIIETYFITLFDNIKNIRIKKVNSSEKWKRLGIDDFNTLKTYNGRKKLSIEVCEQLIEKTEWCEYFSEFNKKDDLADCFLQGYVYLM